MLPISENSKGRCSNYIYVTVDGAFLVICVTNQRFQKLFVAIVVADIREAKANYASRRGGNSPKREETENPITGRPITTRIYFSQCNARKLFLVNLSWH